MIIMIICACGAALIAYMLDIMLEGGRTMKDVETNVFTKNEWEVLYKYFVEEKGLKEIGKDFDMTTERVRQILEKIKRKLAYIHSQSDAE